MTVLHVISSLGRGGAENVLYRLVENSGNPSNHVVISLLDDGVFGSRLRSIGVDVHCLQMTRERIPSPARFLKLVSTIRKKDPTVVQTWMGHADLLGGLAARLVGVPVCWGVHHSDFSMKDNKRSTRAVAKLNARISNWLPALTVSCSERGAALLHKSGYPADKIVVIPNGVDITRFVPASPEKRSTMRRALGVPENAKLLGHLGRANPLKDHKTLIHAFSRVADADPTCMLLLAGHELRHDSQYLDGILHELNRPDLHRRILALGPRDDVADLMNVIDIFILSSISEAFPVVLIEAMAVGTPCVVTDVGDSAEIVDDTGWVLPPQDISGLADAVLAAFAEKPEVHRQRCERARARIVSRYGIDRMVNDYASVWHRARREDCRSCP